MLALQVGSQVMEALDSLARGGGGQRTAALPGDILQGSRAAKAAICKLGLPGDPSEPADLQVRCSSLSIREPIPIACAIFAFLSASNATGVAVAGGLQWSSGS